MSEKKLPSGNYLLVMGIALVILGVLAIAAPVVAGTALVYVIGSLMLLTGIVQLISGFREESWGSKLLGIVLGAITGLFGIVVLTHPLHGLVALTLVLAVFFVIEGIWKIVASFSYRPASGWLAMLLSGVIGLILGAMIWNNWPSASEWAIGVLVGVDLLCTGASLIALAITLKTAMKTLKQDVEAATAAE